MNTDIYDVVVVGGGPAGATAANDLALAGRRVLLLDKAGRVKPCGGAVPPQLLLDFGVPESLLVNQVHAARIVSPTGRHVDMPVEDGWVGMVDRDVFDDWLRARAERHGAERRTGIFSHITRDGAGTTVHFTDGRSRQGATASVRTRMVIGADGALSKVARQEVPRSDEGRHVFAYHEIIASPTVPMGDGFVADRCDVFYEGKLSPDFYGWVFPHGATTSVGTGTFQQGFGMREAIRDLRERTGLAGCETIRREGAPIPLKPLPRWENGRDVVLAGDAAGVVAPASGEGIFYAMTGGRLAADAVEEALVSGNGRDLARARRRFMRAHGQVFWVLDLMQRFWYTTDRRRESFVRICDDRDVQWLTFQGYMYKRLVRGNPLAHARIFFKNIGHLTGLVPA